MIVREKEEEFILINQHDHAKLSGDIANHLLKELFGGNHFNDVVLAAYEHDRGWIGLDRTPKWNGYAPYSFIDYPMDSKLMAYKQGLDEIEDMNTYACLLCSLHYASFFHKVSPPEAMSFIEHENVRQRHIVDTLGIRGKEIEIRSHLGILQFCDRLSLYVCLNKPGADKEREHSWYKAGIAHSESINPSDDLPIITNWLNLHEISVKGFPFEQQFESEFIYKRLSKKTISDVGIGRAYQHAECKRHEIIFRK